MKPDLVLIHGWGVHSKIWLPILPRLKSAFHVTPIDLPGYGTNTQSPGEGSLESIAQTVLDQAPPHAIWVAWSLGGTIAMEAALQQPERIAKLQLISTTPRFLNSDDWDRGVSAESLQHLARQFDRDYARGLKKFLLLQSSPPGSGCPTASRASLRSTINSILTMPNPNRETLNAGLTILNNTDFRKRLSSIQIETQVIAGESDSIVPAAASEYLSRNLPRSSFHALPARHLPFLDATDPYMRHLNSFAGSST